MKREKKAGMEKMSPLEVLSYLAQAPEREVLTLGDRVSRELKGYRVLREGPGLVRLPLRDPRTGNPFYLGEVLVYEAWLRFPEKGVEGYGMVLGERPRMAKALAFLDAALALGLEEASILALAHRVAEELRRKDEELWKWVESTRLEVETL